MELMIVVAIIGILMGIAMPSYRDYVRRSATTEGLSALSDYRIKMEQYYQDNRKYGTSSACANVESTPPSWSSFTPPGARNFTYACETTDTLGQNYVITATGASTSVVKGHVYVLSSDAAAPQRTTKFKGTDYSDKNCWLVRGDEC